MLKAGYTKYRLHFREPAGTSRGVLTTKETYFIRIWEETNPAVKGIGECALFRGLSVEDSLNYEEQLHRVCRNINRWEEIVGKSWSSIRFGIEMALRDLQQGGKGIYFPSAFIEGKQSIEINGLVWMGDRKSMERRIREKLEAGFHCIKLKIGAIDFEAELSLLRFIRQRFAPEEVELRVDANGAFTLENVFTRLEALAPLGLHSIEQPIRQGQWTAMARICAESPVAVALDEELIGVNETEQKKALLQIIQPAYLVLKPALVGGFSGAEEWIRLAQEERIGWWVTSALESNIGLSALAQWTATLDNRMPQGLGTGRLYTNNIPSPLRQEGEMLWYDPAGSWGKREDILE